MRTRDWCIPDQRYPNCHSRSGNHCPRGGARETHRLGQSTHTRHSQAQQAQPAGITMHRQPKTFSESLVSTFTPTKCVTGAADEQQTGEISISAPFNFPTHPLPKMPTCREQPTQKDGQKAGSRRETSQILRLGGVGKTHSLVGLGVRESSTSPDQSGPHSGFSQSRCASAC